MSHITAEKIHAKLLEVTGHKDNCPRCKQLLTQHRWKGLEHGQECLRCGMKRWRAPFMWGWTYAPGGYQERVPKCNSIRPAVLVSKQRKKERREDG